jgi:NADPH-dependent 2,4-dienoyl-CoA reductase/sulfur reductase-like enzyme
VAERTRVTLDGRELELDAAASLASALANAGVHSTRRSVGGEPRGPVCGMGTCFECRATVDGHEHERTCLRLARGVREVLTAAGAQVGQPHALRSRTAQCDVLVVGAGPAGLAAAVTVAQRGRRTLLVDDNPASGGQIWRADTDRASARWRDAARAAGVEAVQSASAVAPLGERELRIAASDEVLDVRCGSLVLCTGATELLLPFPGWTLPGVLGAGGIQALAKGGLDVRGKRVVLAGSGPLLLAVAAQLAQRGARVVCVAEQAPRSAVLGFAARLAAQPARLAQALKLRLASLGTPYRTGTWPVEARGDAQLRELVLSNGTGTTTIACDYAGVGFGLVPNGRLAALLGCALDGRRVRADAEQRTSVPWVYAAGECTGVGGVDKALLEGRVAGAAATADPAPSRALAAALRRERAFAQALERAFALRPELRALARADTIVCRCEDVRRGALAGHGSWRDRKLQARAGMGACQGRVCGPALEFLEGWEAADVRPPLVPVPLDVLAPPQRAG